MHPFGKVQVSKFSVPPGACRFSDISDNENGGKTGGRWRIRLTPYRLSVRFCGRRLSARPPEGGYTGQRVSLARSIRRMAEAIRIMEAVGPVRPTHMVTLTLPPEVWGDVRRRGRYRVIKRGRVRRRTGGVFGHIENWKRAKMQFLDALKKRLKRGGYPVAWFWWVEFQEKRGAPHLHLLLDLGGRLPEDAYQEWATWITREWEAALGVPAPWATRIEALRVPGFAYAMAYARKPEQKRLPFPGPWGRTWGVAGEWAELVRGGRRAPASTWVVSDAEAVGVVLEVVHRAREVGIPEDQITAFERAFAGVRETAIVLASGGGGSLAPRVSRLRLTGGGPVTGSLLSSETPGLTPWPWLWLRFSTGGMRTGRGERTRKPPCLRVELLAFFKVGLIFLFRPRKGPVGVPL